MKNGNDLIFGDVVSISIIYRIPLFPDSYFIHWTVTIFSFDHMTGENREFISSAHLSMTLIRCAFLSYKYKKYKYLTKNNARINKLTDVYNEIKTTIDK